MHNRERAWMKEGVILWPRKVLNASLPLCSVLQKALDRNPDQFFVWIPLTLAYSLSGRETEAGEAASEILRLDPGFSVKRYIDNHPPTDPGRLKLEKEALLKAGLPE